MAKKLLRNLAGEIVRTPSGALMYEEDGLSCCCADCCCITHPDRVEFSLHSIEDKTDGDCPECDDIDQSTFTVTLADRPDPDLYDCKRYGVNEDPANQTTSYNFCSEQYDGGSCRVVLNASFTCWRWPANNATDSYLKLELDVRFECRDPTDSFWQVYLSLGGEKRIDIPSISPAEHSRFDCIGQDWSGISMSRGPSGTECDVTGAYADAVLISD